MNEPIYGAIDIGSNAVRALVGKVKIAKKRMKVRKVHKKRIPLRLGTEVLQTGSISPETEKELLSAVKVFAELFREHGVSSYRACATESLRIATNGGEVLKMIYQETGINIELINGKQEAQTIFDHHIAHIAQADKGVFFADVGGGSTDVVVRKPNGAILNNSFPIGTLRILNNAVPEDVWASLNSFLHQHIEKVDDWQFFGSGGNIRALRKLAGKKKNEPLTLDELLGYYDQMAPLTVAQRMEQWKLKSDRADVIVPALTIFTFIMKTCGVNFLYVPPASLNECLILSIHKRGVAEESAS